MGGIMMNLLLSRILCIGTGGYLERIRSLVTIRQTSVLYFCGFCLLVMANVVHGQNPPIWYAMDQQFNEGVSGNIQTVNRPQNVSEGDLIIVTLHYRMTNLTITSSDGFQLIRNETSGVDGNSRGTVAAFYKVATASEPATYTFTTSGNAAGNANWRAVANRVTGHDMANPIGNHAGSNSGVTTGTSRTVTSINTSLNRSLLVGAVTIRDNVTNLTVPTGMTSSFTNTSRTAASVSYQIIPSAGATGNKTWNWSTSEANAALMFVVNPDPTNTDLEITKVVTPGPYYYGENVTFTLTASNLSNQYSATEVIVNDLLPGGLGYMSHVSTAGTYVPVTGVWNIGNLGENESEELTIEAVIVCGETDYTNVASISGFEPDYFPGNNTAAVSISPQTGTAPCPVVANDDLVVTLQGTPATFNVLANDKGAFDPASLAIVNQPALGVLTMGSGGEITYLPNGNVTGTDQFVYEICDNGAPQQCDQATVMVVIEIDFIDPCQEASRAKTFYLPFPENETQLRKALWSAGSIASMDNSVRNVVSIKVPYPNTIIVYDHWEDGYEDDITVPVQSTTEVWGDGDPSTGVAPGYPDDIIPAGGYIILDETFAFNRSQTELRYDGRDKIYSTADIMVSKVTGGSSRFEVQNVKTDVLDVTRFGRQFTIGFGENTDIPTGITAFRYVSVFIRAAEDGTIVNLDYNADGIIDLTQTLNEGEVWFYDGTASTPGSVANDVNQANDLKEGATITSNKPVGVDILFGDIWAYGTRNLYIMPAQYYSDEYITPVHTTLSTAPVVAYFYNSATDPITINWTAGNATSGTLTVPGQQTNYLHLEQPAGYHFVNPGGEPFTAVVVVDADEDGRAYDWAYTMVPVDRLTNYSSIAWAPGSLNNLPSQNWNPVWATPLDPTTIYVKFDGDLTEVTSTMSPCGIPYDISYTLDALSSTRIFNPSGDQSGMAVYTCDGTMLSVVWGQDAEVAPPGTPALDVGYVMQPKCLDYLIIANDDREVTEPETPVIIPVSSNDAGFLCNIDPTSITTTGLLQPANGSIVINGDGTITYTPNTGFIGTDSFAYRICAIEYPNTCETALVTVVVQACGDQAASEGSNLVRGRVFLELTPDNSQYDPGEAFVPGVNVNLYSDMNCDGIINFSDALLQTTITDVNGRFSFTTAGLHYARDDFDPTAGDYGGNDGTVNWGANWIRSNTSNIVSLADPTPSNPNNIALRLNGPNVTASRSMNFSNATGAALKFRFRRQDLNDQGEKLTVRFNGSVIYEIDDGGPNGTNLFYEEVIIPVGFALINPNAANSISFETNGITASNDYFWIDDVELIYFPACFILQVDPSNTDDRYVVSSLDEASVSFDNLGLCSNVKYLGVMANIIANDDTRTAITDIPLVIDVLTNDVGDPDPGSVTIFSQPSNGSVIVNPNGTITYTSHPGYQGPDQFEYQVCSLEDPAVCDVATVYITVTCASIPGKNVINGIVYGDVNLNGSLDAGEPGVEGIVVELYHDVNGDGQLDAGDILLNTETTMAGGGYQFEVTPPTTPESVMDQFNTNGSGAGNDGTVNWAGNWVEINESDGFGSGHVRVSSNSLEIRHRNRGAYRSVDLSEALTATLSFTYQGTFLSNEQNRIVYVQIATSPSGPWTTLLSFNHNNASSFNQAIDPVYFSSTTTIRFITNNHSDMESNWRRANFDDVQVSFESIIPASYLVRLEPPLPTGYLQTSSPVNHAVTFTGVGLGDCSNNFGLAAADLEMLKVVDDDEPLMGSHVTFTLTVNNLGPSNASGVVVTDLLPSGYTHVSDDGAGAYIPGTGIWTIGSLAYNASATLNITALVLTSGDYLNTATVTGDQGDPVPGNNTATAITYPDEAADLVISKSASTDPVGTGQELIYTITVTNNGPSIAPNVTITDAITAFPDPRYSTDPNGPWVNDWTGSLNIGSLASAADYTLYIRGIVPETTCAPVSNTASVTSGVIDPNPLNNEAGPVVTTVEDVIVPTITSCPANYTITTTNVCHTGLITDLSFSTTVTPITLSQFQGVGGDAEDNCGFTVTYQDNETGTNPIVVSRTFYVTDDNHNVTSCVQTITIVCCVDPVVDNISETICSDAATNVLLPTQGSNLAPITQYVISAVVDPGLTGTATTGTFTDADVIEGDVFINTTTGYLDVEYTITPWSGACEGDPFTVAVTVAPQPSISIVYSDATCFGSSTGTIEITVDVGIGPFTFSIDDGSSYSAPEPSPYTFTGLPAGTYLVRVLDSHGCEAVCP